MMISLNFTVILSKQLKDRVIHHSQVCLDWLRELNGMLGKPLKDKHLKKANKVLKRNALGDMNKDDAMNGYIQEMKRVISSVPTESEVTQKIKSLIQG